MRARRLALVTFVVSLQSTLAITQATCAEPYFPGAVWDRKQPADVGMNPQLLKEAVDFAIASEVNNPRDLKLNHYRSFGREPFGDAIGPIKDRGEPTGVIIRHGYIVAE
jgi:hypothetical protein